MKTRILVLAMLVLVSAGCKLFLGPDRMEEVDRVFL